MMQWLVLAHRNVLRNGRRSMLLGGTIAVGTLALLLFAAYIAASLDGLREGTIRGGLGHARIAAPAPADGYAEQPLQFGLDATERARIESALEKVEAVRRVVPRLHFSGLVSNGPRTINFEANGVDPVGERQAYGAFQMISAGNALAPGEGGRYQVLIGKEMAKRLNVKPGQSVTLMTTTAGGSVNAIDLDVAGIVATGIPELDLYFMQMPLATAQELLRTTKVSYLSVLYQDTAQADAISASIVRQLGSAVQLRTWQELSPLYPQVLALFRNQFAVFGAIIGVIALLGVAAMTLTTIHERTREIGTLRAIGISQSVVRRLFVLEGLLQGSFGAGAGAVLAWTTTLAVNGANISMAPPPGRNVGVPLHLMWVPEYSIAIVTTLPLLAILAAWFVSRGISRMPVKSSISAS